MGQRGDVTASGDVALCVTVSVDLQLVSRTLLLVVVIGGTASYNGVWRSRGVGTERVLTDSQRAESVAYRHAFICHVFVCIAVETCVFFCNETIYICVSQPLLQLQ